MNVILDLLAVVNLQTGDQSKAQTYQLTVRNKIREISNLNSLKNFLYLYVYTLVIQVHEQDVQ